jgi:hypothetical protein
MVALAYTRIKSGRKALYPRAKVGQRHSICIPEELLELLLAALSSLLYAHSGRQVKGLFSEKLARRELALG